MNICFVLGLGYRWFGCRHNTEKKGIVFNIFFVVLMDFTMTYKRCPVSPKPVTHNFISALSKCFPAWRNYKTNN